MARPMTMYTYIHDGILRDVADFEEAAKELDRDDPAEAEALEQRLRSFHELVRAHEHTEEAVLFPALNDRFEYVAETYAFDHEDFEPNVFESLYAAFADLSRDEGTAARATNARRVYRQTVALHEHMRLHIAKENELLIPHFESEFDIDEQIGIAGAMAGQVEPPVMGKMIGWLYDGMTAHDREGMIRFLMNLLPPEPFAGLSGMLAGKGEADWAEMKRRIPELA